MFNKLLQFERELAEYTGAPYVVVTDGCTHAIELAMRWYQVRQCEFTARTYISVPQCLTNLGIEYTLTDVSAGWVGLNKQAGMAMLRHGHHFRRNEREQPWPRRPGPLRFG